VLRWIVLLGLAGLMTAQEPSTFRVNTRLVEVDVVVRSKGGAVTGLTKDDFRILDNGKPQDIATFSVRSSTSQGKANSGNAAEPLPAGMVSNRVSSRGEEPVAATVILLDRLNTAVEDQSYFGKELLKYLKTLQPGEHVAIYSLLKSLRIVQDFTDDPRRLIEAALHAGAQQSVSLAASDESALKTEESTINNLADPNNAAQVAEMALIVEMATNALTEMEDAEKKNRALLTSRALEDIAQHLRGLPGRKKLVWVSGGFPVGALEVNSRHYDEFGSETAQSVHALNNANVAVYAIDPRGLVSYGTNPMIPAQNSKTGQSMFSQLQRPDPVGLNAPNIAAMNLFASGTGGRAIYGTNDLVGALKTVMEDDQVIYTLGFYPGDQKMDGSYHSLSIKIARKGLEVHYRQGYLALDTKVFTPKQRRGAINDTVENPLDATELGLRAAAAPLPGRPGVYRLELTLGVNELHLDHQKDRWVGAIDFGTHFSTSPTLRGTLETIRISLTEDRLRETLNKGFVLRREINAGGETGVLRVVVQDRATGFIGSVRVPIGTE
jgi:VWFA-related protein